MSDVRAAVKGVLQDVLDVEIDELRDDMSAEDFPEWDSLAHLNIMIAVEKILHIRFAAAEISRLKQPGQNIGAFLALIGQKLSV